ncbi:ribonucleoside-diphosphate reductase [Ktedonobacteria bacterium brp13]|nr:ribonucleoside-diphosphate reductase [Ktedonobacteria bacterium brp13]
MTLASSSRSTLLPDQNDHSSHDILFADTNFDLSRLCIEACAGLAEVDAQTLLTDVQASFYKGITEHDFWQALIMAARTRIECTPDYTYVASRLLLMCLYSEVAGHITYLSQADQLYREHLPRYLQQGIEAGLIDERLLSFDRAQITALLHPERDLLFDYSGLQTLYDRYLLAQGSQRIELPQLLWLRVAMGVALNETAKEERVNEFYQTISRFLFTPATPTLFNAGTCHPQLSSCYLTTIEDDLEHIFKAFQDNALLSKWAGGLGNDWTNVRALGAHIKGTNGNSQGVIPFLKVANDTAVAVNQGGKRKGATCAYIENWHLDIEDFLDLRKNTGDDRRRTHDMNTACWISDLFMQRVERNESWTLFSPDDVDDLHDLYGQDFARRYCEYEQQVAAGKITLFKRLPALELWRKMLTRLFETGHPWITWKDPSNIRSSQRHAGVIHSSNLCTEILLNTSRDETAVCNLGSINLAAHVSAESGLDMPRLRSTIFTAIRMLDNVIDINYYPVPEARTANSLHRPIGLGTMGFQDALYTLGISYASEEAVTFADQSAEAIAYYAISASAMLAAERGTYKSYQGSTWQRGLFPIDTIEFLEQERGTVVEMDRTQRLDWEPVRQLVKEHGMRNSNVMAIAPTATISNIVGVSQSIEPTYRNLYVKSNLSGEFTTLNMSLVRDLQRLNLWDTEMLEMLKYYDGSLQRIPGIPDEIKQRYLTAFEIDSSWLLYCASRRQKWLDMGQSLNLYMAEPSGKKLQDTYMTAWKVGLKTTYYLRSQAATQVEKSTVDINRFGIQPRWMKSNSPSSAVQVNRANDNNQETEEPSSTMVCNLGEDCEACQ